MFSFTVNGSGPVALHATQTQTRQFSVHSKWSTLQFQFTDRKHYCDCHPACLLNVEVVELVDLKDSPSVIHDKVQTVTGLLFVGVRHHAEGQPVGGQGGVSQLLCGSPLDFCPTETTSTVYEFYGPGEAIIVLWRPQDEMWLSGSHM